MSSDRLASLVPRLERGGRFTRGEERGGEGGGRREGGGRSEHEKRSDQRNVNFSPKSENHWETCSRSLFVSHAFYNPIGLSGA
ncbi:hypothetical protein V1477_015941 [Vespula maculifrons]|uniref:Uncharacterized protein n=1 Tax=Vespula maculifrons TaxID=7453 RepID=A0ABD2BBL7_VESMC